MKWEDLSAQALFWRPITQDYWTLLSVVAAFGTVFMFKAMLREARARKDAKLPTVNGITVARLALLGGLILVGFAPLNSACQAWAVASFTLSGVMFGLMAETGWNRRIGTPWEKITDILKEHGRGFFAVRDRVRSETERARH